jgi:D-alanyl-D-alanine dipeptidase
VSRVALLAVMVACSHPEPAAPPAYSPPPTAIDHPAWPYMRTPPTDLVLAIADDWTSTRVTITHWRLVRWWAWEQTGTRWSAVIGNAGLAWGDGLHGRGAPAGRTGPVKHEGDGKSPAGVFRITQTFGFEGAPDRRVLDEGTECVDDAKSASYNQIIERTGSADWTSSEHMRDVPQYELGAVIGHNLDRVPGEGSCIFLHIWAGPESTTVGCTAMSKDALQDLLSQLGQAPFFVLLPKAEYDAVRRPWGLPAQ